MLATMAVGFYALLVSMPTSRAVPTVLYVQQDTAALTAHRTHRNALMVSTLHKGQQNVDCVLALSLAVQIAQQH